MATLAEAIFWLSSAALVHTYVLYPLSLFLLPKKYSLPPVMPPDRWPHAALLIAAYNEEKVIAEKIRNALALDYEPGKLEIWIGSDGSTDRTNDIVRGFDDPRVKLVELSGRSGKTGVINRLVRESSAPVLVFSDADVELAPDSLRMLLRHFSDPNVGVAFGGKYVRIPAGAEAVKGEAVYAEQENRIKARESAAGGMSGGHGTLQACRREIYPVYPPGATNDDTVPAIHAVLRGMRVVFEPDARGYETAAGSVEGEFRRRIRIGAGNFQTLFRYQGVLSPRLGVVAYSYFSHKVLRWLSPFLMLAALLASLALMHIPVYLWMLRLQVVFYLGALAGGMLLRLGLHAPLLSYLYHFTALNVALLLGFFVWLRGIKSSAWERTVREGTA